MSKLNICLIKTNLNNIHFLSLWCMYLVKKKAKKKKMTKEQTLVEFNVLFTWIVYLFQTTATQPLLSVKYYLLTSFSQINWSDNIISPLCNWLKNSIKSNLSSPVAFFFWGTDWRKEGIKAKKKKRENDNDNSVIVGKD